jgi:hypothetical protein
VVATSNSSYSTSSLLTWDPSAHTSATLYYSVSGTEVPELMADSSQRKELDAFFNFFATFELSRTVTSVGDLSDGSVLFEVLSLVCVPLQVCILLHTLTLCMCAQRH